jgi:soluble lytic murein transglycosylase
MAMKFDFTTLSKPLLKFFEAHKRWFWIGLVSLGFLLIYPLIYPTLLPDPAYLRGKREYQQEHWVRAQRFWDKALKQSPQFKPYVYYYLAEMEFSQKNFEKAWKLYESLKAADSDGLFRDEVPKRLLECLDELGRQKDLKPTDLVSYARWLQGEADYGKSIRVLQYLQRYFPSNATNADVQYVLGLNYFFMQDLTQAQQYFSRITSSPSYGAGANYYLAKISRQRNQHAQAVVYYENLLKAFPNSRYAPDSLYGMGNMFSGLKQMALAKNYYQRLIDRYPRSRFSDDALWKLGYAEYQNKNWDGAIGWFDLGQKVNPAGDMADALLFWSAKTFAKKGDAATQKARLELLLKRYDLTYYAYRAARVLNRKLKSFSSVSTKQSFEKIHVSDRYRLFVHWHEYDDALREIRTRLAQLDQKSDEDNIAKDQMKWLLAEVAVKSQDYYRSIELAMPSVKRLVYAGKDVPRQLWLWSYPKGFWEDVSKNARRYNLDPYFVLAVILQESRFKVVVASSAQAHGLMQIIPPTARVLAQKLKLSQFELEHLYEPAINVKMGTFYLSDIIKTQLHPIFTLCEYNAGPLATSRWKKAWDGEDMDEFIESITYEETRWYVKRIMEHYWQYLRIYTHNWRDKVGKLE